MLLPVWGSFELADAVSPQTTMNVAIGNGPSSMHAVQTVLVCTVASQSVYVIGLKLNLTEDKLDQEPRVYRHDGFSGDSV